LLEDVTEEKNQLKKDLKKRYELTCQTHNSGHKTEITHGKKIKTNYKVHFSISLMLND
jgi:hypothetical protein